MKIGIFTGTFDPFTIGHQNIAERALPMFDKLVIAVAVSKLKHASEEISKRVEDIKAVFPKECSELVDAEDASKGYRLEVVSYDDLTIDLAHRLGARFLVRGVRSAKDFEYNLFPICKVTINKGNNKIKSQKCYRNNIFAIF